MSNVFTDISTEMDRVNDDFGFLNDIKAFDVNIAKMFQNKAVELRKYAALIEGHYDLVDEVRRPMLFAQVSYGYRRASEAVSWALVLNKEAYRKRKRAEGIAFHDGFYHFAERQKEKNDRIVKETDKTREWYIQMDPEVQKARREEALMAAILEQFSSLKFEFIQGSSALKAMYYGNKDQSNINSATANWTINEKED